MTRVLVLNGPNLGRLGVRDPQTYGSTAHAELATLVEGWARDRGLVADVRQTDAAGELIGWLHEAADAATPVVLNAGAWSHFDLAVADACAMLSGGLVEVHISNIHAREEFRHHSVISPLADAVIVGAGVLGYRLALDVVAERAR